MLNMSILSEMFHGFDVISLIFSTIQACDN